MSVPSFRELARRSSMDYRDAIVTSHVNEATNLQRQLNAKGLGDEMIAIFPGQSVIGMRLRRVIFPETVYYGCPLPVDEFERWKREQLATRIVPGGAIIEIP